MPNVEIAGDQNIGSEIFILATRPKINSVDQDKDRVLSK